VGIKKDSVKMPWIPDYVINKKWQNRLMKISFSIRSSKGFMGRFGGGWNWKLGFQAGGRSVVISLLIAELTISLIKQ
jgi:hypothetical protein